MVLVSIESTAHTFGVGVVHNGDVLSNETSQFTTTSGGMIPFEVAEHHQKKWFAVFQQALQKADVSLQDVEGIAFSQGPGLGNCLKIGAIVAKSISVQEEIPLIPVNHSVAHLEAGRVLGGFEDPLLLYVSGANTQIITYKGGRYRVIGETLDMGLGNFLDSIGRKLDLGFPSGPKIEELAKKTDEIVDIPYGVKGMDITLGGIYTYMCERLTTYSSEVIANTIQETTFAMVTETTERGLSLTDKDSLVLGGGVACNKRLQEMTEMMAGERGCDIYIPPKDILLDNGAMIGIAGELLLNEGRTCSVEDVVVLPKQRTDQVTIPYR